MSELETEHTYQLRQAEATQAEKLKEVHEGYCAAIEELKEKNEVIDIISNLTANNHKPKSKGGEVSIFTLWTSYRTYLCSTYAIKFYGIR